MEPRRFEEPKRKDKPAANVRSNKVTRESDPWALDLGKMSEEAKVLNDFTKTVHEQLMERGIKT